MKKFFISFHITKGVNTHIFYPIVALIRSKYFAYYMQYLSNDL